MRNFLIVVILLLEALSLHSQDKIHKKRGDVITAKITEVGVDEIKYRLEAEPDGPVYVIEKYRLAKIVFANGRVETYHSRLKDPSLYTGQQKSAIKINFLSPLFGHTLLNYEKSKAPGRSLEFSLSLIGLGSNFSFDEYYYDPITGNEVKYRRGALGAAFGFGYKFIKTPDFLSRNIRYAHLLQGSYFKPVAYLGSYRENILEHKPGGLLKDHRLVVYGSLMTEFGKQWVVAEKVVLDMYFGVGYAFDNVDEDSHINASADEYSAYHYTNIKVGRIPALALNTGFRIGILLGQEKSSFSKSSSSR